MNQSTRIVADDLQNVEVSSLVEYITATSGCQATQRKKVIDVAGLTNAKIRFLLKKFLYSRHLAEFDLLDTAGNFEIVHLKPEEKKKEQPETLSPTMLPDSVGFGGLPRWGKPSDMIEWEGQPPTTKKTRYKKG